MKSYAKELIKKYLQEKRKEKIKTILIRIAEAITLILMMLTAYLWLLFLGE